ncbi:MAG: hypothetical protein HWD61_14240 [Parachlamydiaceae bacterium]|nr:MAG: hypothetical protein HWD61_14240 [Parachlamydiaceae bacterium]
MESSNRGAESDAKSSSSCRFCDKKRIVQRIDSKVLDEAFARCVREKLRHENQMDELTYIEERIKKIEKIKPISLKNKQKKTSTIKLNAVKLNVLQLNS